MPEREGGGPVKAAVVGLREIADRLGVEYRTTVIWRQRGVLPEPSTFVGRSPVWDWRTIERWAVKTGRLAEA